MELRQLEHFLAVAEHLNFTRAARGMHVVQSSLSTSVQALERELGAVLFERTTRRVSLTPAGWALLPVAENIIRATRTARESVAAVSGVLGGDVAVGTIQALTWVDLPTAITAFSRAHPGVELTLREAPVGELYTDLREGVLDLVYVARDGSALPPGVVELAARHEALVVVAASTHPLAGRSGVELGELGVEAFVDFLGGSGLQVVVDRLCQQAGLTRRISLAVSQLDLLVALVRAGLGIAILPEPLARRTELAVVEIGPGTASRTLSLVSRAPGPTNPAALAVVRDFHGIRLT